MEKIRIGLIGCGGRQGAHMAAFEHMDDVEVVAVADPVEDRRNAAARRFGAKRVYKDHTELYDNESREDMDVQEVFARMGASFSQGEPAVETFRALWEDVTHWGEPEGS